MILHSVRLIVLVGLVLFGATARGMTDKLDSTATRHHVDTMCGPTTDC